MVMVILFVTLAKKTNELIMNGNKVILEGFLS